MRRERNLVPSNAKIKTFSREIKRNKENPRIKANDNISLEKVFILALEETRFPSLLIPQTYSTPSFTGIHIES